MTKTTTVDPTQACEAALREEWETNKAANIWRSQNRIIERLLERRIELIDAYAEIHAKLKNHPHALAEFFRAVTYTGVSWNPEKNAEARATRDRLVEINQGIAKAAGALAALVEERSELENSASYTAHGLYHIGEVIEAASRDSWEFKWHLHEPLQALRAQYDFKYWPSIAACAAPLAQDAEDSEIEPIHAATEAATRASRGSQADFFKALFVNIDEYGARGHGLIPIGFRLTDETIASLATCILDLPEGKVIEGAYVKRLRQREREALA